MWALSQLDWSAPHMREQCPRSLPARMLHKMLLREPRVAAIGGAACALVSPRMLLQLPPPLAVQRLLSCACTGTDSSSLPAQFFFSTKKAVMPPAAATMMKMSTMIHRPYLF